MKVSFNNYISTPKFNKKYFSHKPSFKQSLDNPNDTFEYSDNGIKTFDIKIQTPMGYETLTVRHNPLDRAIIYKKVKNPLNNKITKEPFFVDIATSVDKTETTFHFLEPKTKEEVGYVIINNIEEALKDKKNYGPLLYSGFLYNYPEEGFEGQRISVEYLENLDENKYSGIGKVADQISVEFCKKNQIEPNIISIAALNSHAAHYKRGKRFFIIDKDCTITDYYEFVKDYNTNNPNEIIKKRIEETPDGKIVYTEDLGSLLMYMPKETVEKYLKLAEANPILH